MLIDANGVPFHENEGPVYIGEFDPGATKSIRVVWGGWLLDGETITARSWQQTGTVFVLGAEETIATETVEGIVYNNLEGISLTVNPAVSVGVTGTVTCTVTTDLGRVEPRSFKMKVAYQ